MLRKSSWFLSIQFICIITILHSGCSNHKTEDVQEKESPIHVYIPTYANGFQIEYFNEGKEIVLFDLENLGEEVMRIGVNRDTTQRHLDYHFKADQLDHIACLSTTHLSYFEALYALDKVVGVSHAELIKDSTIVRAFEAGSIVELSNAESVEAEKLLSLETDVFLSYPFGQVSYHKIESVGIPVIPISEYLEDHPLGRAEWLLFFAALIDREPVAMPLFEEISNRYIEIASTVEVKMEMEHIERPLVLTGSLDNGVWFAPSGKSYIATFIDNAGGAYIFKDNLANENVSVQFEELLDRAGEIDFWGFISYDDEEMTKEKFIAYDQRYEHFKALHEGGLFSCNTARTDYFGRAMIEPDVVLADLVEIFHPTGLHTLVYFKKVP